MEARRRPHRDPYYRCELYCNHDLGSGMSINELLDIAETRVVRLAPQSVRRSHRLASAGPVSVASVPGA